jgi:hypothetical protein
MIGARFVVSSLPVKVVERVLLGLSGRFLLLAAELFLLWAPLKGGLFWLRWDGFGRGTGRRFCRAWWMGVRGSGLPSCWAGRGGWWRLLRPVPVRALAAGVALPTRASPNPRDVAARTRSRCSVVHQGGLSLGPALVPALTAPARSRSPVGPPRHLLADPATRSADCDAWPSQPSRSRGRPSRSHLASGSHPGPHRPRAIPRLDHGAPPRPSGRRPSRSRGTPPPP